MGYGVALQERAGRREVESDTVLFTVVRVNQGGKEMLVNSDSHMRGFLQ